MVEPVEEFRSEVPAKHIEPLIEGLKSGEFVGYIAVGIKPNNRGLSIFQCAPSIGIITTIGAAAVLQHDLIKDCLK